MSASCRKGIDLMTPDTPKILIVDDQPDNIAILAKYLRGRYVIHTVTSGHKALEHIHKGPQPDLILLDIMMPEMNGYEVCRRLKADKHTAQIPIIFVTALNDHRDETEGLELGAVDYIVKPFNRSVILARVQTHLDLKRHRDYLEQLAEERAKKLVHNERLAMLGTLTAGIAHEIKNPLSYITGFAELIDMILSDLLFPEGLDAAPKKVDQERLLNVFKTVQGYCLSISEGVERVSHIIEAMRAFSRKDSGRIGLVDLDSCIQAGLKLCQNSLKRYRLIQEKALPPVPKILGNTLQLEQVFVNLFKNAADAMSEFEDGTLTITTKVQGEKLVVMVDDTGHGIPEDRLETIWHPFETTKESQDGTGLGLSISRQIVENCRGRIWSENLPDTGARFIMELPKPSAHSAKVLEIERGKGEYRVLIVENADQNRNYLHGLIEQVGFLVQSCSDAVQGLKIFSAWKPHLVLLDIGLEGMDGKEAARQMRNRSFGKSLPIIAVTASAAEHYPEILAEGCTDILAKPFSSFELFHTISNYIDVTYRYQ